MQGFEGLNWTAIELTTGQIICDLPGIELSQGVLSVTIGQVETASVALNVNSGTAPEWYYGTTPGAAALIAWTGDPTAPVIIYGGIVQQRQRTNFARVNMTLATCEDYLRGCYITSGFTEMNINQDIIVAGLMSFAAGTNQLPFSLNHLANASTQLQSVAYASTSSVTVLKALQDLSSYYGGPEWTITWQWNLSAGTIIPVFNYGQRIGQAAINGIPAVTLSSQDLQDGAAFTEDYSEGFGANQVTAVGAGASASATSTALTATATGNLNGRPLWQYQYQPNSVTTDPNALAAFAAAAVNQIQDGSQPLSLTLPKRRGKKQFGSGYGSPGKQFGVDWFLGDDIGWYLTGPTFPIPVSGVARVVGYHVDYESITPVLQGAKL